MALQTKSTPVHNCTLNLDYIYVCVVLLPGAYVPLTDTGSLLVNNFHVSCYASFEHNIAHVAMAPLRWFPWLLNWSTYIEGVQPYVHYMKKLGRILLPTSLLSKTNRDIGYGPFLENGTIPIVDKVLWTMN